MRQNDRDVERLTAFFTTLLEELNDVSPATSAVTRQVQRARKKARFRKENLRDKAIGDFISNNSRLADFVAQKSPAERLDPFVLANARLFITEALERYTSTIDELAIQQPLEVSYLFDLWRFGPGASNGVKGTHTVDKIHQDMTCTALCEPLVLAIRRKSPYFCASDGRRGVKGTCIVEGSRLTTVPKNEDTERTIAIEPSGNMALQLAAGVYLENTLRRIGLDISKQQPKNMAMAKRGSIDGSVATLDLKAASDMISTDLVRALLPREWSDLIMTIRSPIIKIPDSYSGGGRLLDLTMVSTMGNGFTFPLMTFIIAGLLYGFRCTRGGPTLYIDWSNTCIYGDDIIIPVGEYAGFIEVLEQAGFIVNYDKSFSTGSFRESCGGDFDGGVDITPFYVKSLATDFDLYVAINQTLKWSGKTKVRLDRSLSLLRSFVRGKPHLVPEWMDASEGVLTSGCPRRYTYLKRDQRFQPFPMEADGFTIPLLIGGYVEVVGDALFYLPRSNKPDRAKVRRLRLPKGYLSGWDPSYWTQLESEANATTVAIHFGF